MARNIFGSATISPSSPVPTGSWGTWTIRYFAAGPGIDDGGSLRIAFRYVSDWARPQMDEPAGDNFLKITCSNAETKLVCSWRDRAHIRPYQPHLFIEVIDSPLKPGEEITLTYGDTSGGGRGTRVQTFVQDCFDFQIAVDPYGTGVYETVPDCPWLEIVPGEAHRLVMFTTGDGSKTHPARVLLRSEDLWGNPTRKDVEGLVKLSTSGIETDLPDELELKAGSILFDPIGCNGEGILRIRAEHPDLGGAEGAPLVIKKSIEDTAHYHHFWGDLHGQSGETVGTNSAEQYFHFARDASHCDFSGHQGNDFQITDDFWDEINRLASTLTVDGKFVVFPGYEWSGLTSIGGDRNVLFLKEGRECRRSGMILIKGKTTQERDFAPLPELFKALKESGDECILIPHIGGRRANLDFHDPDLEPVVEVHSCWGTFEWFFHDALRRGYRVGVVSGSDGHKGRPGAEHAGAGKFGVYGGLTCILADRFNRDSLFHALQARRCYGTSGPRIHVNAALNGYTIGSDIESTQSLTLELRISGTAGIEKIEFLAAGHPVQSWEAIPYAERPRDQIRIRWSGARILNRKRATEWDGSLQFTGNRLAAVEGFAFDSPNEGIQDWDGASVTWESITTGDEDGLLLSLEETEAGTIEFRTELVEASVSIAELADGPVVLQAGGIEQQVIFEFAPPPHLTREVVWSTDVLPDASMAVDGVLPLHLRIRQTDGHRAWTSPWFVHTSIPKLV